MKKVNKLRFLSFLVITYMLLAFTWWAVLLFRKNQDAFLAKAELLKIEYERKGKPLSEEALIELPSFITLQKKYDRQEKMIYGEAAVFVVSLVIGIWLINRSYHKEMEATNQQRNFLLSITHELKSPIASIRLVIETFLKRTLSSEQFNQLASNALNDTDRLHTLVNNLLFAAKVEKDYDLKPHMEVLHINRMVNNVVARFKKVHPGRPINTNMPSRDILIRGDKEGLLSVLQNLIENAHKYSVSDTPIRLTLQPAKDSIILQVIDEGIGLSASQKEKVFDKFYRVGQEETRSTKGTGLGLFIVKQIIENHGGSIRIRDNKPKGCIFEIVLPRNQI